jgi:hypothetical protein
LDERAKSFHGEVHLFIRQARMYGQTQDPLCQHGRCFEATRPAAMLQNRLVVQRSGIMNCRFYACLSQTSGKRFATLQNDGILRTGTACHVRTADKIQFSGRPEWFEEPVV